MKDHWIVGKLVEMGNGWEKDGGGGSHGGETA